MSLKTRLALDALLAGFVAGPRARREAGDKASSTDAIVLPNLRRHKLQQRLFTPAWRAGLGLRHGAFAAPNGGAAALRRSRVRCGRRQRPEISFRVWNRSGVAISGTEAQPSAVAQAALNPVERVMLQGPPQNLDRVSLVERFEETNDLRLIIGQRRISDRRRNQQREKQRLPMFASSWRRDDGQHRDTAMQRKAGCRRLPALSRRT